MLTDPWFYAIALPTVFLVGLSKGGFLTGIGALGVPLMSLAVPPTVAAGIMLPVLVAMDAVAVWSYRETFDLGHLKVMLPGAIVGLTVGWLTAAWVTEAHISIILGLIGLGFLAYNVFLKARAAEMPVASVPVSWVLTAGSGFTSFISHAGGPLMQVYLQPNKLAPVTFAGTMVMCFAALNAIKLAPFVILGFINWESLKVGFALLPMAVGAAALGVWAVRRVPQEPFYALANICLAIVSLELIRRGVVDVLG